MRNIQHASDNYCYADIAFSALMLLVVQNNGIWPVKH